MNHNSLLALMCITPVFAQNDSHVYAFYIGIPIISLILYCLIVYYSWADVRRMNYFPFYLLLLTLLFPPMWFFFWVWLLVIPFMYSPRVVRQPVVIQVDKV